MELCLSRNDLIVLNLVLVHLRSNIGAVASPGFTILALVESKPSGGLCRSTSG